MWLAAITGVRRGELCGVQIRDIDLDNGWLHIAFNYVVKGGKKIRKDTKTHQDGSTSGRVVIFADMAKRQRRPAPGRPAPCSSDTGKPFSRG